MAEQEDERESHEEVIPEESSVKPYSDCIAADEKDGGDTKDWPDGALCEKKAF